MDAVDVQPSVVPAGGTELRPSASEREVRIVGRYRTQSRAKAVRSILAGRIVFPHRALVASDVNGFLTASAGATQETPVNLSVIEVLERTGAFSDNDDALYYRHHFVADADAHMPSDLLDLSKLRALFVRRIPMIAPRLSPVSRNVLSALSDGLERIAVNEYMCHEGGHALGYSIQLKMSQNFFQIEGRLCWPLIYMEEFRADLRSWAIATELLPAPEAAEVILYTFLHRLGLAAENLLEGRPGAGFIPFLHFHNLVGAGLVIIEDAPLPQISLSYAPAALIDAGRRLVAAFEAELGSRDCEGHPQAADALLEYAARRVGDVTMRRRFAGLFAGAARPTSDAT
jgi:hypothetical protein